MEGSKNQFWVVNKTCLIIRKNAKIKPPNPNDYVWATDELAKWRIKAMQKYRADCWIKGTIDLGSVKTMACDGGDSRVQLN